MSALPAGEAPPLAVARLTRAQFAKAVRTAPGLSAHRRGQAWAVAALMRADGTLEVYQDELAVRLDTHPSSAKRLLAALVHAGLLERRCAACPAGPPVYVARSPLMIVDLSAGPEVTRERGSLPGPRTRVDLQDRIDPERGSKLTRVTCPDLRKRKKPRARARVSTAGTAARERHKFQPSTGPDGRGVTDGVNQPLCGPDGAGPTLTRPLTRERAS